MEKVELTDEIINARRRLCERNNKHLQNRVGGASSRQTIQSRSGIPGNTLYENSLKHVGSIACYDVADADCGSAISTGSCFVVQHPTRTFSWQIVTAAHVAIPDFMRVNEGSNPYLITNPLNTPTSEFQWGVTTLYEWPYQYICDLYNDATGRREFLNVTLLGVDWHSDLAVFEFIPLGGTTLLPIEFAADLAPTGSEVFALNNLWSEDPLNMAKGCVRQESFQPDPLILPSMTTTVELGSGSSGAAFLVPDSVDPTTKVAAAGMYTSSIKKIGVTYSTGSTAVVLTNQFGKIIDGINWADANSPMIGSEPAFTIIMSVSNFDLGIAGEVLQVDDLNLIQPLPSAIGTLLGDLNINGGYVFEQSLPFGPLQSVIRNRDLLIIVKRTDATSAVELGIYPPPQQEDLYTAIGQTVTSLKEIQILRWGNQGYNIIPFSFSDVDLRNHTANSWSWWFQWLLMPYGAGNDFEDMDPMSFSALVNDTVARQQWQRIVDLGPAFSALNNESLRPEAEMSTEQTSRIEAIINEVIQQLDVYALAAGDMAVGSRRRGKIVGSRRRGKIVGSRRREGKIVGSRRREGKIVGSRRREGKIVGSRRREGKIVGSRRREGKIVGSRRRRGKIVGADDDEDEFYDDDEEFGFTPDDIVEF